MVVVVVVGWMKIDVKNQNDVEGAGRIGFGLPDHVYAA